MTLLDDQWSNNFLIDYYSSVLINESERVNQIGYSNCETSKIILADGCDDVDNQFYLNLKRQWIQKTEIFLPLNVNQNHWILIYVNVTTGTYFTFDPINSCPDHEPFFHNFRSCYDSVFPENEIYWSINGMFHPLQNDGFNCGIFVLYFIQKIIEYNIIPRTEFDPSKFRNELKITCLQKSLDVKNRCLMCGQGETRISLNWVSCNCCTRWVHYNCIQYLNVPFKKMQDDSFVYCCDLCQHWSSEK